MFLVSNIASNRWIWFKTTAVEQKTESGWQTFSPTRSFDYRALEGGVWTSGYSCLVAVGWPPGLPTNATWRLRVGYGEESKRYVIWNQKIGRQIFPSGKQEGVITTADLSL